MRIEKRESDLKAALVKTVHQHFGRSYVLLAHSDSRKYGIPDLSLSGHGKTTWWECKHATPTYTTKEIQELTCMLLDRASYCRYIVYYEIPGVKYTYIYKPHDLHGLRGHLGEVPPRLRVDGHDHYAIAQYMRRVHEGVNGSAR